MMAYILDVNEVILESFFHLWFLRSGRGQLFLVVMLIPQIGNHLVDSTLKLFHFFLYSFFKSFLRI